MRLSENEQKVITVLIREKRCPNAYGRPVEAIAEAMGWTYDEAAAFVWSLRSRELVRPEYYVPADLSNLNPGWIWKKGTFLAPESQAADI